MDGLRPPHTRQQLPPARSMQGRDITADHQAMELGACESCRKSKVRCDKAEPACSRCVRMGRMCIKRLKRETPATAFAKGGGGGGGGGGPSRQPMGPPTPLPRARMIATTSLAPTMTMGPVEGNIPLVVSRDV